MFLIVFSVSSGWLYVKYDQFSLSYDFSIRAATITVCLLLTLGVVFPGITKYKSVELYELLGVAYFLYLVGISVIRYGPTQVISPSFRIIILFLLIRVIRKLSLSDLQRVFLVGSFVFVVEGFLGLYLFESGTNINGMWRLGGPIGSASGYAALFFLVNAGSIMIGRSRAFLSIFLYMSSFYLVFATGSRSVLISTVLFGALILLLKAGPLIKVIFISGCILFSPSLLSFLADFPIIDRFTAIAAGGLDNSSLYRLFILKTFVANVSGSELFFGLGLNGFPTWFEHVTGDAGVAPHIELLTLVAEGGVLGLGLFFGLCVSLLSALKKRGLGDLTFGSKFVLLIILSAPVSVFILLNPTYFLGPMIMWVLVSIIYIRKLLGRQ